MTGISKRFLDPRAIEETISEVAVLARDQGIEVALVGGIAMELYGSDRLTKDVDFVASTLLDGIQFKKRLSFGGMAGETETGHPVDVIVRDDDYARLYSDALSFARDIGLPVKVVTPDYLAAMKLAARRPKDEEDLKKLISLDVLDFDNVRDLVREHLGRYALDEFDSLVLEVEMIGLRGED